MGVLLGVVVTGLWSGWTVRGEDARVVVALFVVLGAFAGSVTGAVCGTLCALVHQVAQRSGSPARGGSVPRQRC